MFVTDEDYRVVIGDDAIKILSRCSQEIRNSAETMAVEEISGYLRPRYDCKAVFSVSGAERNPVIVMRAADIALYHMAASLPLKMGMEIRKERYDLAIKWLRGIATGDIVPDLPADIDENGSSVSTTVYHTEPKLHHNW